MKLASGPVDTAPLTAVATVDNTMAAVALQPEKESPSVNKPWPMVPGRILYHEIRKSEILGVSIYPQHGPC